ncbi:hypothetical protein HK102_012997 [Quaeritorhiza haematococci]|nr:hypothetical protein HK102_012997 [Quaeritorhiza haematococci]
MDTSDGDDGTNNKPERQGDGAGDGPEGSVSEFDLSFASPGFQPSTSTEQGPENGGNDDEEEQSSNSSELDTYPMMQHSRSKSSATSVGDEDGDTDSEGIELTKATTVARVTGTYQATTPNRSTAFPQNPPIPTTPTTPTPKTIAAKRKSLAQTTTATTLTIIRSDYESFLSAFTSIPEANRTQEVWSAMQRCRKRLKTLAASSDYAAMRGESGGGSLPSLSSSSSSSSWVLTEEMDTEEVGAESERKGKGKAREMGDGKSGERSSVWKLMPPELLAAIFGRVRQGDLLSCCMVGRHWNQVATQQLFRSPTINSKSKLDRFLSLPSTSRYLSLRHLDLSSVALITTNGSNNHHDPVMPTGNAGGSTAGLATPTGPGGGATTPATSLVAPPGHGGPVVVVAAAAAAATAATTSANTNWAGVGGFDPDGERREHALVMLAAQVSHSLRTLTVKSVRLHTVVKVVQSLQCLEGLTVKDCHFVNMDVRLLVPRLYHLKIFGWSVCCGAADHGVRREILEILFRGLGPSLRSLRIGRLDIRPNNHLLSIISDRSRNLQELKLWANNVKPNYASTRFAMLFERTTCLTTVGIKAKENYPAIDHVLFALAKHCPLLEKFYVDGNGLMLSDEAFGALVEGCPRLKAVIIAFDAVITRAAALRLIEERGPQMEAFQLPRLATDHNVVCRLSERCPNLRDLSLSDTSLTSETLSVLASHLRSLHSLQLKYAAPLFTKNNLTVLTRSGALPALRYLDLDRQVPYECLKDLESRIVGAGVVPEYGSLRWTGGFQLLPTHRSKFVVFK